MVFTMKKNSVSDRYCEICGFDITDQFYLQVGTKRLHNSCLKCRTCLKQLSAETSCYEKNSDIFCKPCYYQMIVLPSCMGCNKTIATSDLVMQAKEFYYHVNCFRCSACFVILQKGNRFGLKNRQLYCESHFVKYSSTDVQKQTGRIPIEHYVSEEDQKNFREIKAGTRLSDNSIDSNDSNNYQPHPTVDVNPAKQEYESKGFTNNPDQIFGKIHELLTPRRSDDRSTNNENKISAFNSSSPLQPRNVQENFPIRKSSIPTTFAENTPESLNSSSSSGEDDLKYESDESRRFGKYRAEKRSRDQKTKRVRTTFKQSQLLAMKELFDVDKNPDAKALEALSNNIHLTKRVLQVWFQNARAKHRRGQSILGEGFSSRLIAEERDDEIEDSSPNDRSKTTRNRISYNIGNNDHA